MILMKAIFMNSREMSLYGRYIKERENRDIIEREHGFATYAFVDKMCYIVDVYVVPEQRQKGVASSLIREIEGVAIDQGATVIATTADPQTAGCSESMQAILAYGFICCGMDDRLIWFKKELSQYGRSREESN